MESKEKISLPKDAEGREIPLDTKVLYDSNGDSIAVSRYQLYPNVGRGCWNLRSVRGKYYRADEIYLTPPDSWDKLLEDLGNASKGGDNAECCYARRESVEVGSQCYGCSLFKNDDVSPECSYLAYADIAARIRKLRGEE